MKLDYEPRGRNIGRSFSYEWIVILVPAILLAAMIVQPRYSSGKGRPAKVMGAQMDLATIRSSIETFRADTGRYPSNSEGIEALVEPPTGISHWNGPYLEKLTNDPWAHPYVYRRQMANRAPYDLFSCGPDGDPDTGDDIR